MLESGNNLDEELAAMKAQFLEPAQQLQSQPPSSQPSNTLLSRAAVDAAVDAELEDLKRMLDQL